MQRLAESPPTSLAGQPVVAFRDLRAPEPTAPSWRGPTLLVEIRLDGARVMVRPSGTEPKLKLYVDLQGELGDADSVTHAEELARDRALALAKATVEALGLGA
jgi:phosphomannomutase